MPFVPLLSAWRLASSTSTGASPAGVVGEPPGVEPALLASIFLRIPIRVVRDAFALSMLNLA